MGHKMHHGLELKRLLSGVSLKWIKKIGKMTSLVSMPLRRRKQKKQQKIGKLLADNSSKLVECLERSLSWDNAVVDDKIK